LYLRMLFLIFLLSFSQNQFYDVVNDFNNTNNTKKIDFVVLAI